VIYQRIRSSRASQQVTLATHSGALRRSTPEPRHLESHRSAATPDRSAAKQYRRFCNLLQVRQLCLHDSRRQNSDQPRSLSSPLDRTNSAGLADQTDRWQHRTECLSHFLTPPNFDLDASPEEETVAVCKLVIFLLLPVAGADRLYDFVVDRQQRRRQLRDRARSQPRSVAQHVDREGARPLSRARVSLVPSPLRSGADDHLLSVVSHLVRTSQPRAPAGEVSPQSSSSTAPS
jgi:hypothetical protein